MSVEDLVRDEVAEQIAPEAGPELLAAPKPELVIPSMDEIRALEWNGFKATSLFAGTGGSSTGYRMAGYKMVYANEVNHDAANSYRANASEATFVHEHDVREVTGADLMERAGVERGELDLFDGSPPCASFSTVGRREKTWGVVKNGSDKVQRSDDLFFEYARLLNDVQPRVFVAENVEGLIRGKALGYFKLIMRALTACGYRVEARLVRAYRLGVPQLRPRVIIIGVRDDLDAQPVFPKPLPYSYTCRDLLPWLVPPRAVAGPGQTRGIVKEQFLGTYSSRGDITDKVMSTFTTGTSTVLIHGPKDQEQRVGDTDPETGANLLSTHSKHVYSVQGEPWEARRLTLAEVRRFSSFPADFTLTGNYSDRWARMGLCVPPFMMRAVGSTIHDEILAPLRTRGVF